jgi:hypothetical protein
LTKFWEQAQRGIKEENLFWAQQTKLFEELT